eukprot:CAMPEP_0172921340 /NCGR_PEP_ID=MMETSP1075-20121228/205754_1 /TAXON_ID=2916 /ORGANISM="Ceratium fusus, Strain PA161109" /LENGTH=77 /DNA_ID=CAMNT_0013781491 /DNA_START=65 /DNA_END=294 /DNA_ORIENTATION=-
MTGSNALFRTILLDTPLQAPIGSSEKLGIGSLAQSSFSSGPANNILDFVCAMLFRASSMELDASFLGISPLVLMAQS